MTEKVGWLIHFVAYYACWVICIYFAAKNNPWSGPIICLGIVALQILWQAVNGFRFWDALYFSVSLALIGAITDTLWLYAHYISFNANPFNPFFAAPWMICLWLSFGFNAIMLSEKLLHRYFGWGVITFFSLPFTYWLGAKVGAAEVSNNLFYLYLGILWAFLLPLSFYLYLRFKKGF